MKQIFSISVLAALTLAPAVASAGPVSILNNTTVLGSDGMSYSSIGPEFRTLSMAASGAGRNGSYELNLVYTTTFDGVASTGSVTTNYPDIFLSMPAGARGAPAQQWVVALGDESANGGLAAGLYEPGTVATSETVWGGRTGYIYGAGFQQPDGSTSMNAPVVMTSGADIAGTTVHSVTQDTQSTYDGNELYQLDVSIAGLSKGEADLLTAGFTAFWGTGDCANGAFLASTGVDPFFIPVPEPASLPFVLGGWVLVAVGGCTGIARRVSR